MSFKKYLLKVLLCALLIIGVLYFLGFFDTDDKHKTVTEESIVNVDSVANYLPLGDGEIVRHKYYTLAYNEEHEQAAWVYYTPCIASGNQKTKRTDNFREDLSVKTYSATPNDYLHSGYDRGHLCPAADMNISLEAMSETFLMSNMSPQKPGFNRGIWKYLEEEVRTWAMKDKIWIVTGPVFKDIRGYIGENKVSVPGYYYKVIYSPAHSKMIGFLLPNDKSSRKISDYVVSVDSIEKVTGLDFFSQLPDSLENVLESNSNYSNW